MTENSDVLSKLAELSLKLHGGYEKEFCEDSPEKNIDIYKTFEEVKKELEKGIQENPPDSALYGAYINVWVDLENYLEYGVEAAFGATALAIRWEMCRQKSLS